MIDEDVAAYDLVLIDVAMDVHEGAPETGVGDVEIEARPPERSRPGWSPRCGAAVWLRVCDQGPGIETDFEAYLFDAFSQQSIGDRRDAAGLGLGLYLSRELAQAMDGSITYQANEPTGSCFEIRLPAP